MPALLLGLLLAGADSRGALAQSEVGPPRVLRPQEPPAPALPDASTGVAPPPAAAAPRTEAAGEGTVEVQSLRAIDVSSAGLIDDAEGGLGVDLWRGIARPLVERLLPRLPVATASPAMRDLARRLLLTRARVPAGPATVPSLLGLRVERLSAAGDTASVNALMSLAPADLADRRVARAKVDALLLSGDPAGACADLPALVADDPGEVYWIKGMAFCRALAGAPEEAAFVADLLRDRGVDDPPFFALLGALAGDRGRSVESLLDPAPLHIAMMRAARLPLPADAIAGAAPATLVALARWPNADLDLRLAAAERAEAAGALDTATLGEIYRSVAFAADELADPAAAIERLGAPRANALLYQIVHTRETAGARAEALALAWRLARARGSYATAVRVNLAALATLDPAPELAWLAEDAVRALYTAGDLEGALAWFAMAQRNASTANPEAALAVQRLWPLPHLGDRRFAEGWGRRGGARPLARRRGHARRRRGGAGALH